MDLPLRPLLIDCRIELRKALRQFDQTDLCHRIDAALSMLGNEAAKAADPSRPDGPAAPSERTAQQVAYAWQMAARNLKSTHPSLYAELQKEVLRLLDGAGFADANAEIERLKQDLEEAEAAAGRAKLARMKATGQLNTVCKALAAAAPQVPESGDAQATALARIEALVKGQGGLAAAGGGAGPEALDPEAVPPPPFVLELVQAGQRSFTKAQREFAVAEAMIVTGWQYTPVELLERGEAWLAGLLLNPDSQA
ncbi:MAG: hypothetical protein KatS3mg128_1290 [Silanimonas sp.]|nr:MAG: hypothetical protein KatS3mg127_0522 [Silanimonas sp.]GIX40241.1 MAG: hypothetical protein KatS3mg128_1290 [Silanimonas sp.]